MIYPRGLTQRCAIQLERGRQVMGTSEVLGEKASLCRCGWLRSGFGAYAEAAALQLYEGEQLQCLLDRGVNLSPGSARSLHRLISVGFHHVLESGHMPTHVAESGPQPLASCLTKAASRSEQLELSAWSLC